MTKSFIKILKLCIIYFLIIVLGTVLIVQNLTVSSTEILGSTISELSKGTPEIRRVFTDVKNNSDAPGVLPADFVKALENDNYSVYYKSKTGETALMEKETGFLWFSNPQDRESDVSVEGSARSRIGSQISLTYYTSAGKNGSMDSVNDCLSYGNLSMQVTGNTLSATYLMGKIVTTVDDVPQQISKTRYERFAKVLSEDEKKQLKKYYSIATLTGAEGTVKEKLIYKYPNIKNDDIFYLTAKSDRLLKNVKALWDKTGYTSDDLVIDNEENKITSTVEDKPNFAIVLEYTLTDSGLCVSVDTSKLSYSKTTPLCSLTVLEYFGAAGKDETGYYTLADGCGSLVYFNSGSNTTSPFEMNVYGNDYAINRIETDVDAKGYMLPVYGITKGSNGILAEIQDGAEYASIHARTSGTINSYNTIYQSFSVVQYDQVSLSNSRAQDPANVSASKTYDGSFTVLYNVMKKGNSDYDDMAVKYREILISRGDMKKSGSAFSAFSLSSLGGVPDDNFSLTDMLNPLISLTPYDQLEDLVKEVKTAGVTDLDLQYNGWTSGGSAQKQVQKIDVSNSLGGKRAFGNMMSALSKQTVTPSFQIDFINVYNKDGFSSNKDNIRLLSGDIAVRHTVNLAVKDETVSEKKIYLLSPAKYIDSAKSLLKKAKTLAIERVTLDDLGNNLNSDFKKSRLSLRSDTKKTVCEALKLLSDKLDITLKAPNMYALKFAKQITDLPSTCSGYEIECTSVPFYQTVVSGVIPYTCEPINYLSGTKDALLNMLEYKSGISLFMVYNETSLVKDSSDNSYYTGDAKDYINIIPLMKEYIESLNLLGNKKIIRHQCVANGVYKTTFEEEYAVIVNYNSEDSTSDGMVIKAKGFVITKGGDLLRD